MFDDLPQHCSLELIESSFHLSVSFDISLYFLDFGCSGIVSDIGWSPWIWKVLSIFVAPCEDQASLAPAPIPVSDPPATGPPALILVPTAFLELAPPAPAPAQPVPTPAPSELVSPAADSSAPPLPTVLLLFKMACMRLISASWSKPASCQTIVRCQRS